MLEEYTVLGFPCLVSFRADYDCLTDGGLGVDKSLAIDKGDLRQRSCCARYFSDGIQPPPSKFYPVNSGKICKQSQHS